MIDHLSRVSKGFFFLKLNPILILSFVRMFDLVTTSDVRVTIMTSDIRVTTVNNLSYTNLFYLFIKIHIKGQQRRRPQIPRHC